MNSALYEGYLAEREQWTRTFLKTHTYGARVRHEIYAELIFPVLLAGSKRNDAWSLYWLAGTCQNLYSAHSLYELIKFKRKTDLLKDAYAIDRASTEVREALLKVCWMISLTPAMSGRQLYYGALNGLHPTSVSKIMSEVAFARELDREYAYALSIDEFESKVKQYKERLMSDPRNPF